MEQEAGLLALYNELKLIIEDCASGVSQRMVLLAGRGAALSLKEILLKNCRIAAAEINPYIYCKRLMEKYVCVSRLFNGAQDLLLLEPVKSILAGLVSVLESRLLYFTETMSDEGDPIIAETNEFTDLSANSFSDDFLKLTPPSVALNPDDIAIFANGFDYNAASALTDALLKRMEEIMLPLVYEDFKKELEIGVKAINDMDKRQRMSFFCELLKNEYNELSIIINKQISGIEGAIALWNTETNEYKTVFEILTALREAYQYTGSFIKDQDERIENAAAAPPPDYPYEEFINDVHSFAAGEAALSAADCERYAGIINPKLTELKAAFEAMYKAKTAADLNATGFNHVVYHIKKYESDNRAMTDALAAAFTGVTEYYGHNQQHLEADPDYNIMKGINETIAIKIICLNDNKEVLSDAVNELLESGKSAIPELTEHEINALFENWIKNPCDDIDINDCIYLDFREKRRKQHDALIEQVNKKSFEYMKDHLLFEVSTYEEIMNYSVTRLVKSVNPAALDFAEACLQVEDALLHILKRDNIIPIRPAPHEAFNHHEHEALMAEKNPDFQKGEIIKLMNCGYKRNNVVLIRANVIAAR